jgi:mxaK protein
MATNLRTWNVLLGAGLMIGISGAVYQSAQMHEIDAFNQAVQSAKSPENKQSFEAKFSAAYWLAKGGRYQDASQLFTQLMETAKTPDQRAAVQYNLGNIFFLRGLLVNRSGDTVHDEAEYLLTQAKLAYQQSLRLDNTHLDARHNLDRVLSMLPEDSVAKDDQDKPGIVMGNIPVGLP